MSALHTAATVYARLGWPIFPCRRGAKLPAGHLAPHGVRDATCDLERIAAWWAAEPEANIGIATGARSGLVVVDLDGPEGERSYGLLVARHGPPALGDRPDGMPARTPSGGWHLYLASPDAGSIRNSASRLGPGVDVRGLGGYVVAPPSVAPHGEYRWAPWVREHGLAGAVPTLAPAWATLLLPRAPEPRPALPVTIRAEGASPYGLAALRAECEAVAGTPWPGRNDRLNRAAFAVGQLVAGGELAPEPAAAALVAAGMAAGLGEHETRATVASGMRGGLGQPRAGGAK